MSEIKKGLYGTPAVTFDDLAEKQFPLMMQQARVGSGAAQLLILLDNGWNERDFNGLLGAYFRAHIAAGDPGFAGAVYAPFGPKLLPFAYRYRIGNLDPETGEYLVEQYLVEDEKTGAIDGVSKFMDRLTLQGLTTWDPVALLASFRESDPDAIGVAVYTDLLFKSERMMRPLQPEAAKKLPGWCVVGGLDVHWGGLNQHGDTDPEKRTQEFLAMLQNPVAVTLVGEIDKEKYGALFPAGRK